MFGNKIFVDLECTCNNDDSFPREEMEIIEFGAYITNSELEVIDTFNCFVKPTIHSKLTDFCKELTTISQNDVNNAETLDVVMPKFFKKFRQHNIKEFYSFGAFDYHKIRHESERVNVQEPRGVKKINFKDILKALNPSLKRVGTKKALNILNLEQVGTQHRAKDDAYMLYLMYQKIFSQGKG
tara:strand:+ start:48869 stop:49417 length:549 start_codon:yes stop_codon:yes gene_type:complete